MKAKDVATYIVNHCLEIGKPITNLQLQKVLYFVQGEYYMKKKSLLIEDDFYAWKYGPVIRSVYDDYCVYGGAEIYERGNVSVDETVAETINPTIEKYMNKTHSQLVKESYRPGGAWDRSFNGSKSAVIPKLAIMHDFGEENGLRRRCSTFPVKGKDTHKVSTPGGLQNGHIRIWDL